jgi:hypothetical protein
VEILGFHHDPKTIKDKITEIYPPLDDLTFSWELRQPKTANFNAYYQDGIGHWHRDGASEGGKGPYAIIVWSNRESTEVKDDKTDEILSFPPGAIVLIRNHQAKHRRPKTISPNRWFARVFNVRISKIRRNP